MNDNINSQASGPESGQTASEDLSVGNKPKIHVSHLKKHFGDLEVLNDINADIYEGEVIVVIGPSGSGKSTFLRCLNGLEEVTEGHVFIEDKDLSDKKTDINKVRENIGMEKVPQNGGSSGQRANSH